MKTTKPTINTKRKHTGHGRSVPATRQQQYQGNFQKQNKHQWTGTIIWNTFNVDMVHVSFYVL